MKVNIVGKNITVTQGISDKIHKKLDVLTKYFIIGEDDVANVLVRTYPTKQKIEVTIPTRYAFLDHELFNDEDVDDDEVVRTKSIVPKEMSLDEAIMKMELLGHDFFIYTDDETNKIAVCYKRHDGGYGLIETE